MSCHHPRLKVRLPHNLFRQKPGGVQVAIRFINGTPDDNLALAVYRHDRRIAASTAQVGTAQSVIIPGARNDTFDVYVVDRVAFGLPEPSPAISYEGLTQVVYDPPRTPLRALAPDLVALPQQNVTFGPPFESFDDPVPDGSSCHESEIDEDGAQTCLRFDRVLGNIGTGPLDTGPLDIRFDPAAGAVPVDGQEIPVCQRIYRSGGSFTELPSCSVHWQRARGSRAPGSRRRRTPGDPSRRVDVRGRDAEGDLVAVAAGVVPTRSPWASTAHSRDSAKPSKW